MAGFDRKDPDRLHKQLASQLRKGPVTWVLKVQLYVSDELTPVEDNSIEWKESDAPPFIVGELTIPQQDIDSEEALAIQAEIDDKEIFSPWITTPEFVPIGSQNRARRIVYASGQAFRLGKKSCPC
jgi:hypothetical protein